MKFTSPAESKHSSTRKGDGKQARLRKPIGEPRKVELQEWVHRLVVLTLHDLVHHVPDEEEDMAAALTTHFCTSDLSPRHRVLDAVASVSFNNHWLTGRVVILMSVHPDDAMDCVNRVRQVNRINHDRDDPSPPWCTARGPFSYSKPLLEWLPADTPEVAQMHFSTACTVLGKRSHQQWRAYVV